MSKSVVIAFVVAQNRQAYLICIKDKTEILEQIQPRTKWEQQPGGSYFPLAYVLHDEVFPSEDNPDSAMQDEDLNRCFQPVFSSSFRTGCSRNCTYTGAEFGSVQGNILKPHCWFSCLGIILLVSSNIFSSEVSN